MLRSLRNFLNDDKVEHHSADRLKERGVEGHWWLLSTLSYRPELMQTSIDSVSKATLFRLLRNRNWTHGPFWAVKCHMEQISFKMCIYLFVHSSVD